MLGNHNDSKPVVPGRSRNIVLPWNVVCTRFAYQFQRLWRGSWVFPEIKMFQDAPDNQRLFNEGNNCHLSSVLRALEDIDIPDLLQKHSPQLSFSGCGMLCGLSTPGNRKHRSFGQGHSCLLIRSVEQHSYLVNSCRDYRRSTCCVDDCESRPFP